MRIAAHEAIIALLLAQASIASDDKQWSGRFSPDGAILAAPDKQCRVVLWNVASGNRIATLYEPIEPCGTRIAIQPPADFWSRPRVYFSTDSELLATQRNCVISLWNARDGSHLGSLASGCVDRVEFSLDSKFIVTGESKYVSKQFRGETLTVWDVAAQRALLEIRGRENERFGKVTVSPDGKTFMGSVGPGIKLWDVGSANELVTIQGRSASFSQDGKFVIITASDFEHLLYEIETGKMRQLGESREGVQPQPK